MLRCNSPQFVTYYTSDHIRSTENNKNNHERHILTEGLRQKVLHGLRWAWKHAPSWWDRNWNHPPQAFLPVPDDSRCAINISTYPHNVIHVISTYPFHMPHARIHDLDFGKPRVSGSFHCELEKTKKPSISWFHQWLFESILSKNGKHYYEIQKCMNKGPFHTG